MASAEPSREYILVECPSCAARLHPRAQLAGKIVACPDCGRHVRVPPPGPPAAPVKPKSRDPGQYAVSGAKGDKPQAAVFSISCPVCSARLHPRIELAGKRARCPDCDTVFVIPPPKEDPPPRPRADPGQYGVGVARAARPILNTSFLTDEQRLEPEKTVPPPRIWWASRVFTFPWRGETLPRWIWLVVDGLLAAGVSIIAMFLINVVAGAVGLGGAVLIAFGIFVALLMIPWLLTAFYAAGCMLGIIIDTANGGDEVSQWPVADVADWFWRGCYMGFSLAAAGAVGSLAGWLIGMAVEDPLHAFLIRGALTAASLHLLFPLMILSALEANFAMAVLTPSMLRRFLTHVPSCLLFYMLSAVLTVVLLGPLLIGALLAPVPTLFFVGLLAGAWALIYARLVGRLAWRIGQD